MDGKGTTSRRRGLFCTIVCQDKVRLGAMTKTTNGRHLRSWPACSRMSDAPARDPALPAVPPGTTARPPRAGAASNGPPPEVCTPPAETMW